MHTKNTYAVLSTSEVVIKEFQTKTNGMNILARYYWYKLKFPSSFVYYSLTCAEQRLGISVKTMQRHLDEFVEQSLAAPLEQGYHLLSKRELSAVFVPPLQRKYLMHSCTLCIRKDKNTWKDIRDLLNLKLVEQHARKTYFAARSKGVLNNVVGTISGQQTKRIDGADLPLRNGEMLGIVMPMISIANLLELSEKSVKLWRDRMEANGYIKTRKSFQVVTGVPSKHGVVKLEPMTRKQFSALIDANPTLFSNHMFLGRNGLPILKRPLTWEFKVYHIYHTQPKQKRYKRR